MIDPRPIARTLQFVETRFASATSPLELQLLSKLALLELCGWIEEAMDDLLLTAARTRLRIPGNLRTFEERTIDRNSSFEYEKFRSMMVGLVGMVTVEMIESNADPAKLQLLRTTLGILKTPRNMEAHMHTAGTMRRIDAPTLTRSRLAPVYKGLQEIEKLLGRATFTV